MVFNTGAALLDAVVLAVVSKEKEGTYGYKITQDVVAQLDDRFLENASFLRLKNLTLAYSLPQLWLKKTNFFTSARVYLQGQNLLTWTGFTGLDPEVSDNVYRAQYPASRQFTLGVEVSF